MIRKEQKPKKTWEIPPAMVHYIGSTAIPEEMKPLIEALVLRKEARDYKTKREIFYHDVKGNVPPYFALYKNPHNRPTEQLAAIVQKIQYNEGIFFKDLQETFGIGRFEPGKGGHWTFIILDTAPDIAFYVAMMAAAPHRMLLIPIREEIKDEEGKPKDPPESKCIGFRKCILTEESDSSAPFKMAWRRNWIYRM